MPLEEHYKEYKITPVQERAGVGRYHGVIFPNSKFRYNIDTDSQSVNVLIIPEPSVIIPKTPKTPESTTPRRKLPDWMTSAVM